MSNNFDGLMKKTKKELVEIIIRNDDVREELNNQIDVYKDRAEKMQEEYNLAKQQSKDAIDKVLKLQKSLEEANKNVVQHQAAIDELTSQKVEAENAAKCFKNERDSARNWNYVLGIAAIIFAACWIIF